MRRQFAILLVEDDPSLGPLTADALDFFGHAVTLVTDVQVAFERVAAANEFDAIVLDLELGCERGETLIERLVEADLAVPEVIIVSAQPATELMRAKNRLNACAALQKPTLANEIDAALNECLPS